jgi:plastocyanin
MSMCRYVALCCVLVCTTGLVGTAQKKEKPIIILMMDDHTFVEESKEGKAGAEEEPVAVKVGQSVVWRNKDTVNHSAFSNLLKPDKERLFKTEDFVPGRKDSKPVQFTREMFELAGGKKGGFVMLDYYCKQHKDDMKGKIKLIDAPGGK